MAVRWYLRYGLPYRDVEELHGERGIDVDHVTIYRWVTRCDGGGGFSVIETDNAENLLHDLSIWRALIDFQIFPVVDVMNAAAVQQQAIDFRKSVT